jgi:predicted enzyme related to lactoylglutathione lyase
MTEMTSYTPGAFCWADLTSADQQASKRFYQSLFDWDAFDAPIGEGMYYSQMLVRGRPVAAIAPPPPGQTEPASWGVYVNVEDADEAVARAESLGATMVGDGAFDVFEVGRMAELIDPQGTRFRLWQAQQHIGAEIIREPGSIAWYELATTDAEASARFYSDLFNWTITDPGMEGYLFAHTANGDGTAGISSTEGSLSGWIVYLWTDEVDATLAMALAGGATEILPATDIPGDMGRFAVVRDPQGATVGFYRG